MKKLTCIFLLLLATTMAGAQNMRLFKVAFGLGPIFSDYSGSSIGGVEYIEPAFNFSDHVAIGFRFEGGSAQFFEHSDISSRTFTAQYYVNGSKTREFIGAGAGWYTVPGSDNAVFGMSARIGADAGHFSFCVDGNFIFGDTSGDLSKYYGVKIGFFIGGGKKK